MVAREEKGRELVFVFGLGKNFIFFADRNWKCTAF